jgi:hypothetical protein
MTVLQDKVNGFVNVRIIIAVNGDFYLYKSSCLEYNLCLYDIAFSKIVTDFPEDDYKREDEILKVFNGCKRLDI